METNEVKTVETRKIDVVRKSAKVIAVRQPKDDVKRLIIELDCRPFETINMKSGEITDTTNFSKDTIELVKQIGSYIPILQVANTMALGARLNPQIIALSLVNAEIDIIREFKLDGEQRETGFEDDVYKGDTYVTKITNVKPNVDPMNQQIIMMLMNSALLAPTITTTTPQTPNPFKIG